MSNNRLTTSAGAPVADDNNSISVGPRGLLTFDNVHLFEKLVHLTAISRPVKVNKVADLMSEDLCLLMYELLTGQRAQAVKTEVTVN